MVKLMYRIPEAAELLSFSEAYTRRLILGGELPSVTVGRAVRVPHDGLVRWVAEHQRGGVTNGSFAAKSSRQRK